MLCRSATPFTVGGELDEAALRKHLLRLVDANLGVYLGNPGSGEGHALTHDELRRLYKIGVDVCKGRVPVHANPPEQPTARDTLEQMAIAIDAGVDLINLYGPAGRHGYKGTDDELLAYFDHVLSATSHAIALAPDPATGHTAKPEIVANICNRYLQIKAVNLGDTSEDYLLTLRGLLARPVDLCVVSPGALRALDIGAAGAVSAEANIIPKTCRRYLNSLESNSASAEATAVYLQLKKFSIYVSKWGPSNARWIKVCMKVLKLPGGEGGLREPYQLPTESEMRKFVAGLLKLDIPEIDELADLAGCTA